MGEQLSSGNRSLDWSVGKDSVIASANSKSAVTRQRITMLTTVIDVW
jgi:hypothetical protein